jgi:predicted hydrolase (HD superfamily)
MASAFDLLANMGKLITPDTMEAMKALPHRMEQFGQFMEAILNHCIKMEAHISSLAHAHERSEEKLAAIGFRLEAIETRLRNMDKTLNPLDSDPMELFALMEKKDAGE